MPLYQDNTPCSLIVIASPSSMVSGHAIVIDNGGGNHSGGNGQGWL
ncbi:hypothetical protein [Sinobacterium norvegicum]|nr:hypothetical protein [Sinobacterium norvegicum]